ncbi:UbiA family prenyltransferase [Marinimicrobium sp. ABcell2]|uniref:UbiA family prenyltransferase n=1 Tax=Marinimicrobium sp. ABcell2 TaxID=3069751 RepID=UPI0027B3AED7|nr:UbiA family prenyltransferase [Marinimicrobium sp. ABcell2]MDQ2075264.1 UbiA family prenyltransferase [Marinimicrobium sp. ABcell2]
MPKVKTLLTLCRVSNLPTVWMNVVSAALISAALTEQTFSVSAVVIVMLALSCFYAGGMSLNDVFDRHWDAQRQPYRPIPSGRITVRLATTLTLGLFASGFVFLSLAPSHLGALAGLGLLVVIVLYDGLHKRHWSTVFLMSLTRLGVYLVAATALVGEVPGLVWIIGVLQMIYTLAVTVVARWENSRPTDLNFPLIPWMIAGMALLDGLFLALVVHPVWLLVGLVVMGMTRLSQRYVRGD